MSPHPHAPHRPRHGAQRVVPCLAAVALTVCGGTACDNAGSTTPAAGSTAECSGHGDLHGDHCHCDAGYTLSTDGLACTPEAAADPGEPGEPGAPTVVDALAFDPAVMNAGVGQVEDGSIAWLLEAIDGGVALYIELYPAFGAPTSSGAHPLQDADTSYRTCATCIVVQTGCTASGCEHTFMPTGQGAHRIDRLDADAGGAWVGALEFVRLQEVEIGPDYTTTPIPGGEVMVLEAWEFQVLLDSLGSGSTPECGGHGTYHGDHCDCDPGYVPTPDYQSCVPAAECGGHGHYHGDHCDCDPGYVPTPDYQSCVPA